MIANTKMFNTELSKEINELRKTISLLTRENGSLAAENAKLKNKILEFSLNTNLNEPESNNVKFDINVKYVTNAIIKFLLLHGLIIIMLSVFITLLCSIFLKNYY